MLCAGPGRDDQTAVNRPTPDQYLYIASSELDLGIARRACPFCSGPIVVKMPSVDEVLRDRGSHALKLGFDELTTTERELFDFIYSQFPHAVSAPTVLRALNDMSRPSLQQHAFRLRNKLKPHGWLLVRWNGSLRLVEPVPIV